MSPLLPRLGLLALVGLLVGPASASAQGGPEGAAGEEGEVEEPAAPPERSRQLQRALNNFKDKQWPLASIALHKVLQDEEQAWYHPEVSYHLAVCLEQMEMNYSALAEYSRFFDLVEGDHELLAQGIERAVRLARRMDAGWIIAPGLSTLDTSKVSEGFRGPAMYWVGEHHYRAGEYSASAAYLALVPKATTYYARARMLEGIAKTAAGKPVQAVAPLAAAVAAANPDDPEDNAWELANLNLARTYYALGNFERAVEHFERVPRSSPLWFESLYEASWSYFRLGRLSGALSHLQTVDSPFFDDLYHPDATLLRILIFYYLCKYVDGQVMLNEFTERHNPMANELDAAIKEAEQDPSKVFDALYAWRKDRRKKGVELPTAVIQFFEADFSLERTGDYVAGINRELATVDALKTGWEKSELREELKAALEKSRRQATDQKGEEILVSLRDMVSTLRGHLGNAELYKVEMITAEKSLYDAAYQGRLLDKIAAKKLDPSVPDGYRFWPFQGEYWVDELGWYEVVTINECLEIQRR